MGYFGRRPSPAPLSYTDLTTTDLTALSSADAADELVIVDDSAGVTKKITQGNLNVLIENADDYEEGTWTPAFDNGSGFDVSTISIISANYLKIGQLVTLQFQFNADSSSGNVAAGDDVVLTSACIPFSPAVAGIAVGTAGIQLLMGSGEDIAMAYVGFSGPENLGIVFHTVDGTVSRDGGIGAMGGYVTYFTD